MPKARKRTVLNPFQDRDKRANFARLVRAGSSAASAKRLVETNPKWLRIAQRGR